MRAEDEAGDGRAAWRMDVWTERPRGAEALRMLSGVWIFVVAMAMYVVCVRLETDWRMGSEHESFTSNFSSVSVVWIAEKGRRNSWRSADLPVHTEQASAQAATGKESKSRPTL
jgi:hypothetical protein